MAINVTTVELNKNGEVVVGSTSNSSVHLNRDGKPLKPLERGWISTTFPKPPQTASLVDVGQDTDVKTFNTKHIVYKGVPSGSPRQSEPSSPVTRQQPDHKTLEPV